MKEKDTTRTTGVCQSLGHSLQDALIDVYGKDPGMTFMLVSTLTTTWKHSPYSSRQLCESVVLAMAWW
jgi:hypothetical protein